MITGLKEPASFRPWTDSAIVYFRKGLQNGYILPRCLVEKMIPEMQNMVTPDSTKSIFYTPVNMMPAGFSDADKARITNSFSQSDFRNACSILSKSWPIFFKTNTCLKAAAALALMLYPME